MSLFAERLHTDFIVVIPSGTHPGEHVAAADIAKADRKRGLVGIGVHFVVSRDGTVETGRALGHVGAHSMHLDRTSVYVCYVGGVGRNGQPANTMTAAQSGAVRALIAQLQTRYPSAEVLD